MGRLLLFTPLSSSLFMPFLSLPFIFTSILADDALLINLPDLEFLLSITIIHSFQLLLLAFAFGFESEVEFEVICTVCILFICTTLVGLIIEI